MRPQIAQSYPEESSIQVVEKNQQCFYKVPLAVPYDIFYVPVYYLDPVCTQIN